MALAYDEVGSIGIWFGWIYRPFESYIYLILCWNNKNRKANVRDRCGAETINIALDGG
jgi:hypothetical protein